MPNNPVPNQVATKRFHPTTWLLIACWLSVVALGSVLMVRHSMAPGRVGTVPAVWPASTTSELGVHGRTLLVFAHPQCPCTRATLSELETILTRCAEQVQSGKLQVKVLFFRPQNSQASWNRTALWRYAAGVRGVQVHDDKGGATALSFGVQTSGHVLLYDENGQLLFNGGITAARGHAGGNASEEALLGCLTGTGLPVVQTRVFGCAILDNRAPA
jgi:hypothetical protein